MNYRNLLTTINTMYDTKMNPLFRSVNTSSNKSISDSYYLATGKRLSDDTACFSCVVSDSNISYRVVIGKSDSNESIHEVLFVNGERVILSILPIDVIDGKLSAKDSIKALYDMYKFIVKNTMPYLPFDSIYKTTIEFMHIYLTIITVSSWYKGFSYSDFSDIIDDEKLYNEIVDIDTNSKYLLDYSFIYALIKK